MALTLLGILAGILVSPAWAQSYSFPSSAKDYPKFYPTAYKDHGGVTDWNCGGITYDGHQGSDFGGGSWTGMDAGRDIVAAAEGTVSATNDGEFDRCDTGDCDGGGGFGNYVYILHPDGKTTIYGHLKQWSVQVAVGQYVSCGQKLGEMGSSGHSTGPHVHFQVNVDGSSSDPFDGPCSAPPIYWVDQGVYDGLPALVCDDVPACASVAELACGESLSLANDGAGSSTTHAAYGCGEFTYSGPEVAVSFATSLDESVTLRVSGNAADVNLFVLSSPACDTSGVVGCSVHGDAEPEEVAFTATAGQVYTVVVDGWEGAVTAFQLSAECAGSWPGEGPGGEDSPAPDSPPAESAPPPDTGPFAPVDESPVDVGEQTPGKAESSGGCGCASAESPLGLGLLALLGLGARRRSRAGSPSQADARR